MLNRKIIFVVVGLLLQFGLSGQTFQAAAIGGINLSQIDGDNLAGFHFLGANAGLRVVAVLGDRWRIGPEILFSQQGANISRNDIITFDFESIRLNTVEVPLMVYFKDWRFTAEAGIAYQRLINYRVINLAGIDITDELPFKEDMLNFQTGVTFYMKPNLGFNFRWSKSIGNILAEAENSTMKARTMSIRLVYLLGEGEKLPPPPKQ